MSAAPSQYGEIFDRGYHHYDGPRLGQAQRHLGAGALLDGALASGCAGPGRPRSSRMLLYAAVAVPVLIAIGMRAFFPAFEFLGYPEFFGAIFLLVGSSSR